MKEHEQLLKEWFKEKDALDISRVEDNSGIPSNTLRHFLKDRRGFPQKHFEALKNELVKYGFNVEIEENSI